MDLSNLNTPGFHRFATLMGLHFDELEPGRCVCSLDVREELFHPGGIVHGGAAFALADSAMAMAAMANLDGTKQVYTIELKISYMATVTSGKMVCEARVVKQGRRVAFLECEVKEGERLVATATASFAIVET